MVRPRVDLLQIFNQLNAQHFDGFLDPPVLRWNGRLKTSAGRFFPGTRRRVLYSRPPIIEVASYLCNEPEGEIHVRETLAHEMIHYWLWVRHRPYGHTDEFYSKMNAMGARRYNPVPKRRPHKYVYSCPGCKGEFKSRRKLARLACAKCCKAFNGGKYSDDFKLVLTLTLNERVRN